MTDSLLHHPCFKANLLFPISLLVSSVLCGASQSRKRKKEADLGIDAALNTYFCLIIEVEDVLPLDMKGVWLAMEECQKLGLTRAIGVSNFSIKKLDDLLSFAAIPPAMSQVEMNLAWQQKKLLDYCKSKGIVITAVSPLRKGASRGPNDAMESNVVKEIAQERGKSSAQVCLRWLYKQGVTFVPKSY
ncbi:hypothetical protein QN277_022880 [Acacia crassicarpa]|uniref:NADP-dependent oxidoreductase domain-containing protein n=1 Tax=Acacia crassicarpa TaxID=499986 RepID=A0AAE1MJ69_9FABA|nr:hypothetical protein QN277_022880 [Acacia crassicarpa]